MHDWLEEVWDLSEVLGLISQRVEQISQSLKILVVLIGLSSSSLDFLLEFAERSGVG